MTYPYPNDKQFAEAYIGGNWEPEDPPFCEECTSTQVFRCQPLDLEWEPGSDRIGDFVWAPGFCDVAIQEVVCNALLERFRGFEKGPVEMIQEPTLRKPKRITKRTKPRVWLPYEGPPLFELWVTTVVPMHPNTSATLIEECHSCDYKDYRLEGIEEIESSYDSSSGKLMYEHKARIPGQGIFVSETELNGADIFRVAEFSAWILCTNRVKEFIEQEGFTNVMFLEYGDVLQNN